MSDYLIGTDFNRITKVISRYAGGITLFGAGQMGKTDAADSMLASCMAERDEWVRDPDRKPYLDTVAGFLNVWTTGDIMREAVERNLIDYDELNAELEIFFKNAKIDPVTTVLSVIPTAIREESADLIKIFSLRMNAHSSFTSKEEKPEVVGSAGVSAFELGGVDHFSSNDAIIAVDDDWSIVHYKGLEDTVLTDSAVVADGDEVGEAFQQAESVFTSATGRLKPQLSGVIMVIPPNGANIECGVFVQELSDGTKLVMSKSFESVPGVQIFPTVALVGKDGKVGEVVDRMAAMITAATEGAATSIYDASSAHLSPDELSVAVFADMQNGYRDAVESLIDVKDYQKSKSVSSNRLSRQESDDLSRLSSSNMIRIMEMIESMDAVTLHSVLTELNLYTYIVRQNVGMRNQVQTLAKWWKSNVLQLKDLPLLARTEQKANSDDYAAEVYNSSIEAAFSELKIFTPKGTIFTSSDASMLATISGGMLMFEAAHVSALDLTVVRNLEVKTTTMAGGLDSTTLNVAQYLSDLAYNSNTFIVMETRDDFNKDDQSTDEEASKARKSLGANSRFALQLFGDPNEDYRLAWIRCKFYGENYGDFSAVFDQVTLNDYPAILPKNNRTDLAQLN